MVAPTAARAVVVVVTADGAVAVGLEAEFVALESLAAAAVRGRGGRELGAGAAVVRGCKNRDRSPKEGLIFASLLRHTVL